MVNTELVSLFGNENVVWDIRVSPTGLDIYDHTTKEVHATLFPTKYYQPNAPVFLAVVNGVPTTLYLSFKGCGIIYEHLKEQTIHLFAGIVNKVSVRTEGVVTGILDILTNGYSMEEDGDTVTIRSGDEPLFILSKDTSREGVKITLPSNEDAVVIHNSLSADLNPRVLEVFVHRLIYLIEDARDIELSLTPCHEITALTINPIFSNTIH
jgi:hypothetical protein